MSEPITHYDVVIVGAGPTGVISANLLGQYGIRTLVIDREPNIIDIPRAVGICEEGSRIVKAAGVADDLEDKLVPMEDLFFVNRDLKPLFHVGFDSMVNGNPMIRTFHQPQAEQNFRAGLKRFKHVTLWPNTECLQFCDLGDRVELRLKKTHKSKKNEFVDISCRYLLACDGARSTLRKMLNIRFKGKTYGQDWLVVDIKKDPVKDRTSIHFICDPNRPGVTLPTPEGGRRWEFVVKDGETKEHIESDETLKQLLKPWGNLEDMEIVRKTVYTFHAVVAKDFKVGNVFLLGDAAHLTPPFAGQGLMAGLRDAYNLAWKLAYVLQEKLPDKFLDTYHDERRPQADIIVRVARLIGLFILPQNATVAKLRDRVFKAGQRSLAKDDNNNRATLRKVQNNILGYKALLKWHKDPHALEVGYDFPQHRVKTPKGDTVFIDQTLEHSFYIISYNKSAQSVVSDASKTAFKLLDGKFCCIHENQQMIAKNATDLNLVDTDNKYNSAFEQGERILLIRPDRMAVIFCHRDQFEKALQKYFTSLGLSTASKFDFPTLINQSDAV